MKEERKPINYVVVGVRPGDYEGVLSDLPPSDIFELIAVSDEGLEPGKAASYRVACHTDFNKLLSEDGVELVLVDGPDELKRDFAVRGANAGKHVVVSRPFTETFSDAYRMARTARSNNMMVCCQMPMRSQAHYRKVRAAVASGVIGEPYALQYRFIKQGKAQDLKESGLLDEYGIELLDQMLLLIPCEVKDVRACVREVAEGLDHYFRVEMSLRNGGWASVEMLLADYQCDAPDWV